MGPRWKGKGFADIASSNPITSIVKQLQEYLLQSKASALLSGCDSLLEAGPELADLLSRSCFGLPLTTPEKDKQWFQLGPEETFYLQYVLKCLRIHREEEEGDEKTINEEELWKYMNLKRDDFKFLFKAYSHLRLKNWILRPGAQYGVDYVAYRHHPSLVHSEYSVLVHSKNHPRLKVWSDWQCVLRVTGGVAKNLLVLNVEGTTDIAVPSLSCLSDYTVKEYLVSRWVPEQSREESNKQQEEEQDQLKYQSVFTS